MDVGAGADHLTSFPLVPGDALFEHGFADQPFGQEFAFAMGEHPADDVAAVDVEDHVEVEAGPLRRFSGVQFWGLTDLSIPA